MSKLEELIQKLCPDGVEQKALGNVCNFKYGKGNTIPTQQGEYPVYGCNGIVGTFSEYNSEDAPIIGHIGSAGVVNWGEGKHFVTYNGTICTADKDVLNSRYLFYLLLNLDLPKLVKGNQPFLSYGDFANIKVNVPPLEVQREIVRILDSFTELTAELTTELTAELTTRNQQYEFYREKLLTFDVDTNGVVWKSLGEIATIKTGNKPPEIKENYSFGLYEYINAGTTNSGFTTFSNCEGDTVTTPSRGQGGIGFVGYQKCPFWLGPLCYKINAKSEQIYNKYIYYFMCSKTQDLLNLKKEGGVPAINVSDLETFKIAIPPSKVQNQIISILDNFETISTDISNYLSTEVEARQKQYEYYRDKLLTFKRLA